MNAEYETLRQANRSIKGRKVIPSATPRERSGSRNRNARVKGHDCFTLDILSSPIPAVQCINRKKYIEVTDTIVKSRIFRTEYHETNLADYTVIFSEVEEFTLQPQSWFSLDLEMNTKTMAFNCIQAAILKDNIIYVEIIAGEDCISRARSWLSA